MYQGFERNWNAYWTMNKRMWDLMEKAYKLITYEENTKWYNIQNF